jgi:organic radical activating enzyme
MKKEIKILDIFYGNKCNLACSQCDTHSDHVRGTDNDPELESIKESIRLAHKNFNVDIWGILGGEPLLYIDKCTAILDHLRSLDPESKIIFPTNGMLLGKNLDLVADMAKKYNMYIQVCDHTTAFKDKSYSERVVKATLDLAEKLELTESTAEEWWDKIISREDGGPEWRQWLDTTKFSVDDLDGDDRAWIGPGYGVYYIQSDNFSTITKFVDGKPKPYDEGDPKASYWNSCPSNFCALLKDNRIYKCAALGTLETFLARHGSLDDPDWQKYLNYKGLDLTTCTEDDINKFMSNIYCHIDECSMCPKNNVSILKNELNVLPKHKDFISIQSLEE